MCRQMGVSATWSCKGGEKELRDMMKEYPEYAGEVMEMLESEVSEPAVGVI